jgi:hypothetical protein
MEQVASVGDDVFEALSPGSETMVTASRECGDDQVRV